MKRVLLLLLFGALAYGVVAGVNIGFQEWRNREDPKKRFWTEGTPKCPGDMQATAYESRGLRRDLRIWSLSHTPEELKAWLASGDFKRADQRLASVRQILEPKVRPPFRDNKYVTAYMRTEPENAGHFVLVMPGEKQSEYVVLNRPFRGGPLAFLDSSAAAPAGAAAPASPAPPSAPAAKSP